METTTPCIHTQPCKGLCIIDKKVLNIYTCNVIQFNWVHYGYKKLSGGFRVVDFLYTFKTNAKYKLQITNYNIKKNFKSNIFNHKNILLSYIIDTLLDTVNCVM